MNSGGFLFSLFSQTSNKKLTITDCHFTENTAIDGMGGAIDSSCGIVNINNCIFTKNTADEDGAIKSYLDEISIISSTFKENSARASGGAIGFSSGVTRPLSKATINKCTFTKNVANASIGGGAIQSGVDLSVFNSVFSQNKANPQHGYGGAISGGFSKIDNSIFYKNTANHGGAFYLTYSIGSITRSIFYKNSVKTNGSVFYHSTAPFGGLKPVFTISKNVFSGNKGRYIIYKPEKNPSKTNANNNYWGKNMNLKKVNASCYGINISKIANSPSVRNR